ncbi:alpha/beta hydrolase [Thalassomonas viridans]|uniref:Alpha/beta hydrolase n=1 Tax=Thalassomonas viridans TaxID=137584 RepID=A0AAF0C8D1_9GAMM|nr:alpha/beta hydrolase [Thalassomonas viridans]WDE03749.1 alpha/beta hydrolase [Thalassomonas viridans]
MNKQVSIKLQPFLTEVNRAIAQAREDNIILTPELVRTNLDNLAQFNTRIPEISYTRDRRILVEQGEIPVRVYSPAPHESLPVVIYFHGGGHMCGSVELYDAMCRKLALAGHCIVISVDYPLAPEHPFPEGIQACWSVLADYRRVLTKVAFTPELIIAGDSAGGSICTVLAMQNQVEKKVRIDKQILIYPCVDYTMAMPSITSNGRGYLLESEKIAWYFDHYFQQGENRQHYSPLHGLITEDLPQTLLFTAEFDPLRDEALAYIEALKQAGVKVSHHHFDDMIHAFINIEDLVPEECQLLYQKAGEFIRA